MTGTEIYKRTPTYEKESRDIRLHAPHWKLLLAFDGQRTLSEVALSIETSFAEAVPLTQKFLDQSWIEEQPITLEQYFKRINAKEIAPGAAVPPPTVLHEPKPDKTESSTPPPPLPTPAAAKTAVEPPNITAASTSSEPLSLQPANRVMKLSAVVDFITSLVGNISIGQLLVYRVFLRVPPELLVAEDVASVYLVKDNSLIKTAALQKAISDAVTAVAKRALPDSVYLPA